MSVRSYLRRFVGNNSRNFRICNEWKVHNSSFDRHRINKIRVALNLCTSNRIRRILNDWAKKSRIWHNLDNWEKKNLFHYDFLWFNVVQVYGRFVVKTFFCNTNDPSSKTVRFEIPSWFHELLINEIFNEIRPNSDCQGNHLLVVGLGCSSLGYRRRHSRHHNLLVVVGVAVAGHPNLLVVVALGYLLKKDKMIISFVYLTKISFFKPKLL